MLGRAAHKFFIAMLLVTAWTGWVRADADIPDPVALDQERRLKDDSEKQAQAICDSIMGKGRASVLANVEVGLETTRKGGAEMNRKLDSKSTLGDDNYILPWVPAPKSVTKEETPKDASVQTQASQQSDVDVKTVLKRFDLTVVHDDAVPADRVKATKDTLESAFDRYKDVLKIYFRATPFVRETDNYNAKDVVKKNFLGSLDTKSIIYLLLLMLAFTLLKFLFGPLQEFMKNYIDGMKDLARSKVEMDNTSEQENETDSEQEEEAPQGELTPEELAALEEEQLMNQKFEPFTYVTDENLKQLAYLLHDEEPWIVAVVISYLSPERAFKVMEALPPDLQAKVGLETAMYRQTSLEQVQAIDADIKTKIDFVVGGLEKLIVILESADRFARDNILEYLKNEKPAMYERVRENVLLFEDIGNFPKPAMQMVVRELKTEQLARALRGASPELQQKFFENMSEGAVTLLKEEMEYGRPVTDDQIEEERKKIIDMVKTMEQDGKIAFRQRGRVLALAGSDIGSDRRPGEADPAKAFEAYNAGLAATERGDNDEAIRQFELSVGMDASVAAVHQALANAYYAAGRYNEALSSFDAALQIEPNDELRAWVDGFRAQLQAPAA